MTDTATPDGAQDGPDPGQLDPTPITPGGPGQTGTRVEQLTQWVMALRSRFTDAALERSAVAGGFTAEEFQIARALADARQHQRDAIGPTRSKARWAVLAAYAVVWLLFAFAYLGRPTNYGTGQILQGILTISMLIALGISIAVISALRPDPDQAGRALAILLVIPVVLLVGVAGLCLPFVGTA